MENIVSKLLRVWGNMTVRENKQDVLLPRVCRTFLIAPKGGAPNLKLTLRRSIIWQRSSSSSRIVSKRYKYKYFFGWSVIAAKKFQRKTHQNEDCVSMVQNYVRICHCWVFFLSLSLSLSLPLFLMSSSVRLFQPPASKTADYIK